MVGMILSPWSWVDIYDMCSKYLYLAETGKITEDDSWILCLIDGHVAVEELQHMAEAEPEKIYLTSETVVLYKEVCKVVYSQTFSTGTING